MARRASAARLRKTFHYPSSDDDDDASPSSVLDEQEQESLITLLTAQNRARNTTTLRLLSALPLLSTLPFLLRLFFSPTTTTPPPATRPLLLLPILALSSLFATGWMLHRLDVAETGFPRLDHLLKPSSPSSGLGPGSGSGSAAGSREGGGGYGLGYGRQQQTTRSSSSNNSGGILGNSSSSQMGKTTEKSPLETHLPWLNVGLAVLALLTGLLERVKTGPVGTGTTGVSPLLLGALPGVVYAVVIGAKVVMAGVDPERELSGLKYGYKGA
ncbi:hypothetical protein C8A00DRAFT_29614 [Chaetomidium leptoderma]|uniref:Uncharacterized protein n=1 Tax=Chaetomidium leptoderma TaxID=669021 RepID=A0AAN6VU40_9PEZI|nr:hypothetical protein C8A00DRAFT_29614 [Chaetomidium leptoderma]